MNWETARRIHADAVAELIATAETIPAHAWMTPRAEGKWSPAEIVEHLNLAYEVLRSELAGGSGMRVRTKWWQRILLRFTILPKIIRGEPFPTGVRAPREIRPTAVTPDRAVAIATFRERAAYFEREAADAERLRPRFRLKHPYLGNLSVRDAVAICGRHIAHHRTQITNRVAP